MNQPQTLYFRPGQYLFHENDPSQSLFIIRKGSVGIRKAKGDGFVEIARVHSNEVIGELSFFDRLPRSASAVAMTEVQALEIRFDALDKIYAGTPDYFKTIMASIADRLRRANNMIRTLQKDASPTEGESASPSTEEFSAADALAEVDQFADTTSKDDDPKNR